MSNVIRDATLNAVSGALDTACERQGILPPVGITARLWAESVLGDALAHHTLPSQDELDKMLQGVPPLFISDRNR